MNESKADQPEDSGRESHAEYVEEIEPDVPEAEGSGLRCLLLDMPLNAAERLTSAGHSVEFGSLGKPYRVPVSDDYTPVIRSQTLPKGWTDSEVVVVDLKPSKILDSPPSRKGTSPKTVDWWAESSTGLVDPRCRSAIEVGGKLERIYQHGGVFFLFLYPQPGSAGLALGRRDYRGLFAKLREVPAANWHFLSVLENVRFERDSGTIMQPPPPGLFEEVLTPRLHDAHYEVTIQLPDSLSEHQAVTLLENRFSQPVSMLIKTGAGLIFLLPRFTQPGKLVAELLDAIPPSLAPQLFPEEAANEWLHGTDYEHPQIVEIREEIESIEASAAASVAACQERIESIAQKRWFLHSLLRGSGSELTDAVLLALEELGFDQVIDVDLESAAEGRAMLEEDLRIEDTSPILLVEVKGLTNLPRDEHALEVRKYVAPRMRELKRTDVRGLTIINHQRLTAPLERDSPVFRDAIVESAKHDEIGLLTTWDLFRLCRNMEELGWSKDQIKPVLYRVGRVWPIPEHYQSLGKVVRVWPEAQAVGVQLEASLSLDDIISIDLGVLYFELPVTSIQKDDESINHAEDRDVVGIEISDWNDSLSSGQRVFKINTSPR